MRPLFLLFCSLAFLGGCDVCSDYCAEACSCDGDDSDACVSTCEETLNVYSGSARDEECKARIEELQDECY